MNFLTFKKYLQSDNDGTFWPGYIELPDEENPIEIDNFQDDKKESRFTSNPRIYTGLGLLLLVAILFLNQTSAFVLLIPKIDLQFLLFYRTLENWFQFRPLHFLQMVG